MSDFLLVLSNLKDVFLPILVAITAWNKETIKSKLGFKAEEKNIESQAIINLEKLIETLQKHLDIYQEMVEDLDTKYKKEIVGLRLDLEEARNTIKKYREKHGDLS